jgi:hypothetical protein
MGERGRAAKGGERRGRMEGFGATKRWECDAGRKAGTEDKKRSFSEVGGWWT